MEAPGTTPAFLIASDAWRAAYPGASAGVLALSGVTNPAHSEALEHRKRALEEELRARFAGWDRPRLRSLPVLAAFDAYYRRFDSTYHVQLQLESVALKGRVIPAVAALVEAMFMAELQDLLLTAGHDLDALRLPVRLDVATGSERYRTLNGKEQQLKAGDMFMADGEGVISSVLFGPDGRTRLAPTTTAALFAVYAPAGIDPALLAAHLERLAENVRLFAPDAVLEHMAVCTA